MWKKLNSILHDKHDYHLDSSLKRDVEIGDELLQSTLKYQKFLFIRKIKYFFEHDKLFFLRLFLRYFLKLSLLLLFLGAITVVSLLAFGIDINVNVKKIPKTRVAQSLLSGKGKQREPATSVISENPSDLFGGAMSPGRADY